MVASRRGSEAVFWTPYSEKATQAVEYRISILRRLDGPTTGQIQWRWGSARSNLPDFTVLHESQWPMLMSRRDQGLWCVYDTLRTYQMDARPARPRDPA